MGSLIPVVVLVIPFIFVLIILLMKSREEHNRNKLRAELYVKALDAGKELPPELFEKTKDKDDPLSTGILLIAVGIAISLMMYFIKPNSNILQSIAIGIVPFLLGVGFLLIHFIKKGQGKKDEK